jgi:hypothetical protein
LRLVFQTQLSSGYYDLNTVFGYSRFARWLYLVITANCPTNTLTEWNTISLSSAPAPPAVSANRLSANPNNRVLLLEAGGRDWHPFIHMPAGLAGW